MFTYDNAGNRTGSTLTLKSAQLSSPTDTTLYQEEYNATFENLKLKLYPNPTKGRIGLEINQINDDLKIRVVILDANGKKLSSQKINSNMTHLNLAPYPAGIYFLKLVSGDQHRILKVIKQ